MNEVDTVSVLESIAVVTMTRLDKWAFGSVCVQFDSSSPVYKSRDCEAIEISESSRKRKSPAGWLSPVGAGGEECGTQARVPERHQVE